MMRTQILQRSLKFRSKTRQFPQKYKVIHKNLRISSKTSGLREEMNHLGEPAAETGTKSGLNKGGIEVPSLKNPHWLTWRVPEACVIRRGVQNKSIS